jgi:VWFA-related protein
MIRTFNRTVRRHKPLECASLFLFVLILVPFALAQNSAPTGPAIRITTRLVQVSVIVQDEHGEPITGLTKDDFELLDQGKPQRISEFSELSETVTSPPVIDAAKGRSPSEVFTNGVALASDNDRPPQVSVILLDKLNTWGSDTGFARQGLARFLSGMRTQDNVAIYSLGEDLEVVHGFTNDSRVLLAALSTFSSLESRTKYSSRPEDSSSITVIPNSPDTDPRQELAHLEQNRLAQVNSNRAITTADALLEIARHLAGIRGRKSLIWLSSAFPPYVVRAYGGTQIATTFSSDITRAVRALSDANIAVYPVDPRGLAPFGDGLDWSKPSTFGVMDSIAELTGGRATYHTNDIEGAIQQAVNDSRVSYMLGYYPDSGQWDGTFHSIKVKVHRHGVQVRTRQGYFASQQSAPGDEKQRVQLMLSAASDTLESTGVGMKLETISTDAGATPHLKMRLTLDPRSVALNPNSGRWTDDIEIFYVETDTNLHVLTSLARTLSLNLTSTTYEKTMKEGVKLVCDFPIKPGATQIRLVALDRNAGQLGSVTIPLSALFPTTAAN